MPNPDPEPIESVPTAGMRFRSQPTRRNCIDDVTRENPISPMVHAVPDDLIQLNERLTELDQSFQIKSDNDFIISIHQVPVIDYFILIDFVCVFSFVSKSIDAFRFGISCFVHRASFVLSVRRQHKIFQFWQPINRAMCAHKKPLNGIYRFFFFFFLSPSID